MKKSIFIIFSVLSMNISGMAQDNSIVVTEDVTAENCKLQVEVTGIKSDKGTMMVAVYNTEDVWLSKPYVSQSAKIKNGNALITFENLPFGTYGISTYQDENDNEKLDTGLFGIPKEPYASSRGAKGKFGPPKWKDAKFELTEKTQVEEIKY